MENEVESTRLKKTTSKATKPSTRDSTSGLVERWLILYVMYIPDFVPRTMWFFVSWHIASDDGETYQAIRLQ